jgi:hypothetical protein
MSVTVTRELPAVRPVVMAFVDWLEAFGETSYDHQSFFAGQIGRAAKGLYYKNKRLGTLAVSPMILCEAFVPSARSLFWKRQRFPIADAHYASGFAFLAAAFRRERDYEAAVHFLDALIQSRSPGYEHYCWGYPFDWVTIRGTLPAGTPFITTVPYVYEAFRQVRELDGNRRWLDIMESIAEHAHRDYEDYPTGPDAATCSYMPRADLRGVINASAYRAFLLTRAGADLHRSTFTETAGRNLNFVLDSQNADGSWYYSTDGQRDFVDHFHTCFVLKALAKIEKIAPTARLASAIDRGLSYYVEHLFDAAGLPKPFSRAPRLTIYRRELYDYAECINLALLLRRRSPRLDTIFALVLEDLLSRWRRHDGSFRARQLLVGWDNVPMHRWAQAQMFRSLCFLVSEQERDRSSTQD